MSERGGHGVPGRPVATPPRNAGERRGPDPWIIAIATAGLLIRIPALFRVYYAPDVAYWKSWLTYSTAFGIQNVYSLDLPGQTYPPILIYLLWGLGSIYRLLWPASLDTPILTAFVKIPAVAGDLTALLLFAAYARRYARASVAGCRVAAAVFAFHPALIWLSSIWGQVDVLHGGLAVAALLAALYGSSGLAGALVALGILTKPQGLIPAPAIAVLLFARAGWRALGRAVLSGAAVVLVVVLPFLLAGFATKLASVYTGAGGVYPYLSMRAFNPWWCIVAAGGGTGRPLQFRDDVHLIGLVTPHALGLGLFLLATAWILWRFWLLARGTVRIDHSRAFRLLTLQWLAFFLLPTQIHERYLVPALLSLAPAALLGRRWRWAYGVLSAGILLNLMYVVPGDERLAPIVRVISGGGVAVAAAFMAVAFLLVRAEIVEGRGGAAAGVPAATASRGRTEA